MAHQHDRIGTRLPHNVLLPNDAPPPKNVLAPDEKPLPEPEHQRKILKERWFELVTVITLIAAGTGFLIWRGQTLHVDHAAPETLAEAEAALDRLGYTRSADRVAMGRQIISLEKNLETVRCVADLFGKAPDSPVETAIISLVPSPGVWAPTEDALQAMVDEAAAVAVLLVPTAPLALEKAVNTMSVVSEAERPHNRGVAATTDGWKATYVTYQEYDEKTPDLPALILILQRLSAGEDSELADFNRELYKAIGKGKDLKTQMVQNPDPIP